MIIKEEFRMKQLLKVVDHEYNDYIGGDENAMMDGNEYHPWTLEELIDVITNNITESDDYLEMEDTCEVVEAKHFRFLGKERIKALVTGRCYARKQEDGKWMWEKN